MSKVIVEEDVVQTEGIREIVLETPEGPCLIVRDYENGKFGLEATDGDSLSIANDPLNPRGAIVEIKFD